MAKYLLNFVFVFLMLSSLSFAKDNDAALKAEFGPKLTKAPFFLRFDFKRKYNIDWDKSYYSDRKSFLINYETQLAEERAQEKAEAKAAAAKAKEDLREKRDAERKERDKLKAQQAEEKAERQQYEERQKQMNDVIQGQQKELQQMHRDSIQSDN